jgi:TAT (twin-arginine translocation) pathway signal sequence
MNVRHLDVVTAASLALAASAESSTDLRCCAFERVSRRTRASVAPNAHCRGLQGAAACGQPDERHRLVRQCAVESDEFCPWGSHVSGSRLITLSSASGTRTRRAYTRGLTRWWRPSMADECGGCHAVGHVEHMQLVTERANVSEGVAMGHEDGHTSPSRRDFLKGVGTAGAGLIAGSVGGSVATPGAEAAAVPPAVHGRRYPGDRGAPGSSVDFGRMFPSLPPFADATDAVRGALLEIGMPGGIMDAGDDLGAGPKALITDPTVNGNPTSTNPYGTNPDNPTMTAGSTFVGQFTDHDITFDQTSQLGVPQNPLISPNSSTPALDLDSVFSGGPGMRPDLYVSNADGSVGPKLKIGTGGVHEGVARLASGDGTYTALLGDPRNDENVIIAGLHCGHILFATGCSISWEASI